MLTILKGFLRTVIVPFALSLVGGLIDKKLGGPTAPADTDKPAA